MFADTGGSPLAPHGKPRAAWRRIVRSSGVTEPLPMFHDLRHAFASFQLAAGLSAHAVAELLGHGDAGLVLARYGHPMAAEVAAAGERLEAWRRAQRDAETA